MLKLKAFPAAKTKVENLVLMAVEGADLYSAPALSAWTERALTLPEFKGARDEQVTFYDDNSLGARRVNLRGVGKAGQTTLEDWRTATGLAVKDAIGRHLENIDIAVPDIPVAECDEPDLLTAMLEGAALANHLFLTYKDEKKETPLSQIRFLLPPDRLRRYQRLTSRVGHICQGVHMAREWVSTPPNDKRPLQFAEIIGQQARAAGLKVHILDAEQLTAKGFGAMLAVAQGSTQPPVLVILEYTPAKARRTVALVGKGVTFDAGGINLKPTGSLEDMKIDMAGAAAAAATLIAAARVKPGVRLIGAIPIVENMPSGSAARPGDVVRTLAGKTVEIGNTDAEGRLILADALAYVVEKYRPDTVIDLATLTGACVVALGEKIAGVFSSDTALSEAIVRSGETTHERCWPLPLPKDYKEMLKSDIADIKNVGATRWGGAITAALFLAEFVEGVRWAHIDIAGTASIQKDTAYCRSGGTGFGVRLIFEVLRRI